MFDFGLVGYLVRFVFPFANLLRLFAFGVLAGWWVWLFCLRVDFIDVLVWCDFVCLLMFVLGLVCSYFDFSLYCGFGFVSAGFVCLFRYDYDLIVLYLMLDA